MTAKKLLIKISGGALGGENTLFDFEKVSLFCSKIIALQRKGYEIAIVNGGGNIWRHRDNAALKMESVKTEYFGIMGGLMNATVLGETLLAQGAQVQVYSVPAVSVPILADTYHALDAREMMAAGKIVICAGGVGRTFATHDLAAVLRGLELACDVVIKATRVDGVYSADPEKDSNAERFDELTLKEALDQQLHVMDIEALAMAMTHRMPLYVCDINDLERYGDSDMMGTAVRP